MKPHLLMCPPDFYGIQYEINAWMNRQRQADHALAVAQWQNFFQILRQTGAKIELLEPQPGLPDLVFTANAGLVYQNRVVLSQFRPEQRRDECSVTRRWFETHGFSIETLPPDVYFEGAGDALFCGDTLIAGYRMRSDVRGHHLLSDMLGCRVIPLELVDPFFYHLDTCFCPLADGVALYYPAAFDEYGRRVLRETIPTLIEIPAQEAQHFAANAAVVGEAVVMHDGCPQVQSRLRSYGYRPIATPLGEFVKAGGSAKCLTLRLDGEDAAAWRYKEAARSNISPGPVRHPET